MDEQSTRFNCEGLLVAFESRITTELNSGCWLWCGATFDLRGGYGAATFRKFGIIGRRAHRLAWQIYRGPIPPKMHVLHHCDVPLCVNPDHLFLGNQAINMRDKVRKGRQNKGETHGMSKLREIEAIAILHDPRPQKEIADEFDVSVPTVSDIKRGYSWKYLGGGKGRYNRAA